jgi:hypothetical protein
MSKLAASGLVIGTVFAIGAAQAEPLTLTADQMDQVTAAGFGAAAFNANLAANKAVNTAINFRKLAEVRISVFGSGYLADAEGFANCAGFFTCTAETFTGADADAFRGVGTSVSQSVAAAR